MVIEGINIPDSSTTLNEWKLYYDKLKNKFSKKEAAALWAYTWEQVGSSWDTDAEFRKWAEKRGLDASNAVQDGLDYASDFFKRLRIILLVAGGAILVTAIIIALRVTKNSSASDFIPAGRVAKLLK